MTPRERRIELIVHLESIPRSMVLKHFRMSSFMQRNGIICQRVTLSQLLSDGCDTTACAAGWATLIPSLQKDGLSSNADGRPTYEGLPSRESLIKFFGMSHREVESIFYGTWLGCGSMAMAEVIRKLKESLQRG